jgi:hypothetical protein
MCRRVAGGLDPARQNELGKRLIAYLPIGSSRKAPRKVGSHELAEIWRAAASLEHLPIPLKVDLGRQLLAECQAGTPPIYAFWSLARLGARMQIYGPANLTVPAEEAERWMRGLFDLPLTDRSHRIERAFAVVQMGRQTGDRGRDIDPALSREAHAALDDGDVPASLLEALERVVESDRAEQTRLLGDRLPRGLHLQQQS